MLKNLSRFPVILTPRTTIVKPSTNAFTSTRSVTEEIANKHFDTIVKALQKDGINPEDITPEKFQQLLAKGGPTKEAFDRLKQLDSLLSRQENVEVLNIREPVKVTVTGASGQIGYSMLFRIASGEMLGKDIPIQLQLLELPGALKSLEGVVMELKDCAFPQLKGVVQTSDPRKAFEGAHIALLVGAKPRSKGMERADLLKENAKIFEEQGKALNDTADKSVRVLVVGNPANTNAMITSHFAPKIPASNIHAMTKLDHNRGLAQLAEKANCRVTDIEKFCIWGNHSPTMYPDISHCQIKGQWAKDVLKDDKWYKETFIPGVQQRGAAIINARGLSSAASAASSALDHIREWVWGTGKNWTSFAMCSDGSYGVEKGLWYSFPTIVTDGQAHIVGNVPIDKFSAERMEISRKELADEKAALPALLK